MKPADKHIYNTVAIHNYFTGKLTAAEMHAMERAALTDPFLAEAMEGYRTSSFMKDEAGAIQLQKELKELKGRINDPKPAGINAWKIAASLLLLMGSAVAIYFATHTQTKTTENIVVNNPKPINIVIPKPVVIDTGTYTPTKAIALTNVHTIIPTAINTVKHPITIVVDSNLVANNFSPTKHPIVQLARKQASPVIIVPNIYAGQVIDESNNPIPYATLIIDHHITQTDVNGMFNLTGDDSTIEIEISAKGYSTRVIPFNTGDSKTVMLSKALLNKDSSADGRLRSLVDILYKSGAEPREGWSNYLQYLVDQLSYSEYDNGKPVKGAIILNFKIDVGSTPTDFQFEQSIDENVDNAVKNLIVNGPSWKNTIGVATPGSIRLRIIF